MRKHPGAVEHMLERYRTFVAELPPLKPSADYEGVGKVPRGWGWEIGDGRWARARALAASPL